MARTTPLPVGTRRLYRLLFSAPRRVAYLLPEEALLAATLSPALADQDSEPDIGRSDPPAVGELLIPEARTVEQQRAAEAEVAKRESTAREAARVLPEDQLKKLRREAEAIMRVIIDEGSRGAAIIGIDEETASLAVTVTTLSDLEAVSLRRSQDIEVVTKFSADPTLGMVPLAGPAGNDTDYESPPGGTWGHWSGAAVGDWNDQFPFHCTVGPIMETYVGKRWALTANHCGDGWAADGGNEWLWGAFPLGPVDHQWPTYGVFNGTPTEYFGQGQYGGPYGDTYKISSTGEVYDAWVHLLQPQEPTVYDGLEVSADYDTWLGLGENEPLCHNGYTSHYTYPLRSRGQETGFKCDLVVTNANVLYLPENGLWYFWGAMVTDESIVVGCNPTNWRDALLYGNCEAVAYHGDSGAAVFSINTYNNTVTIRGIALELMCGQNEPAYYVETACDTMFITESSLIEQVWNTPNNGYATIAHWGSPQTS